LSPAARRHADARTMAWLVGVPWVAFATSLAWPLFGEFTLYSRGDDWLTYQVSAYRIYLQGAWLQAGEPLFYYQPLYRWIAGALHVVFGDSSAGELLWDCGWLLAGGFLAFAIARPLIGGRGALAAAVATLVLFALTPIWYLIGRGLAEISAAGFAWAAALLLMRARTGRTRLVLLAGTFGVLAYYARLNQMLFAGALLAFLLPLTLPARVLTEPRRLWREVPVRSAAIYAAVLVSGLGLLSLRAWFYTGETSPFAGTSFGLNHTGLAPGTLFSPEVWRNVAHSLFAQAIVNEEFDVRGLIVLGGCVAAVLALLQVPRLRQLPLGPALAVAGGLVGAFAAHAHGYPGRFSVHLVPLAAAVAAMAAWVMVTKAPPPPAGAPPTHAPTRPPR